MTSLNGETIRILRDSGWSEGRDVGHLVDLWTNEIASLVGSGGLRFPSAPESVLEFLREFGGIHVVVQGRGLSMIKNPFVFDPREGVLGPRAYAQLSEMVGAVAYPVGVLKNENAAISEDSQGRFYLISSAGEMVLGESSSEALNNLVSGVRPEFI